jgi:DNA-binding NtrC family response regulator
VERNPRASASTTGHSTVPEIETSGGEREPSRVLGLVIIWCPTLPNDVGAWLPIQEGTWLFGRGPARATDQHPRLPIFRQRPGANVQLPPLDCAGLSRAQATFTRRDAFSLELTRLGRCRISVNGHDIENATLLAGDVVEMGSQVAFLCVERPLRLTGVSAKMHAFGGPDDDGLVGESAAIWALRERIAFIGVRVGHVLVRGESGVGKELVATALHRVSGRKGSFVARNAATIPETLIDAELFGNAEGYPNPGMRERKGLIGTADRGTLFLDEFAELPPAQQAHLLRVLDAGEYQRLGESSARRSDLRLIAATNQPLSAIRPDVLARFELTVTVPDLRSRPEDLPLLVRWLLRLMMAEDTTLAERFRDGSGEPRVSSALVRMLVQAPPSGNLRGLRGMLWSALEQSRGEVVEQPQQLEPAPADMLDAANHESEAARIRNALDASGGSLEKTWRKLELSSRFVLLRLMKKHSIAVRKSAGSAK